MNELKQKPVPKSNIATQEVDRLSCQFAHVEESITDMTLDKMNEAPKKEIEPQTTIPTRTYSLSFLNLPATSSRILEISIL